MEKEKPIVTVTGITGYVGTHVCLEFLRHGDFRVRGTCRDPTNLERMAPYKEAFGEHFDSLELVKADLTDRESVIKALAGSTYVVHVASPLPLGRVKDEQKEVIDPAVQGTKYVLEGCKEHKVKRVVITGSGLNAMALDKKKDLYDENDFTREAMIGDAYGRSKILAEKLAWEYHRHLPEEERFDLIVMLPCVIQGPPLTRTESASTKVVKGMLSGETPFLPKVALPIVDVRDVATAHVLAITTPGAHGRYLLADSCDAYSMKTVAGWLKEEFSEKGFRKVPQRTVCSCMIKVSAVFKPELKGISVALEKETACDNSRAIKELNMTFIDARSSVVEGAQAMIELGMVPVPKIK